MKEMIGPYCPSSLPVQRLCLPGLHPAMVSSGAIAPGPTPDQPSGFAVLYAHTPTEVLPNEFFDPDTVEEMDEGKVSLLWPHPTNTKRRTKLPTSASDLLESPRERGCIPYIGQESTDLSTRCAYSRRSVQVIPDAPYAGTVGWRGMGDSAALLAGPSDYLLPSLFAAMLDESLDEELALKDALSRTAAKVLEKSNRIQKPCMSITQDLHKELL